MRSAQHTLSGPHATWKTVLFVTVVMVLESRTGHVLQKASRRVLSPSLMLNVRRNSKGVNRSWTLLKTRAFWGKHMARPRCRGRTSRILIPVLPSGSSNAPRWASSFLVSISMVNSKSICSGTYFPSYCMHGVTGKQKKATLFRTQLGLLEETCLVSISIQALA
uniref:Uncharacterized protein n=1 Tax=Ixodes ricinus TaxID=34613 RepID=A0A6B0UXD0_IXORI